MRRRNKIDGIPIDSFVDYYLGTKHSCSKLKHQGLKSFDNPYVIGVSNDFAFKYPNYIIKQELIVVIDDYGNPGTYINPINIQKIMELETCKEKIKLLEKISCHSFDEALFLYQVWTQLVINIQCLTGLYSGTYELLYMLNKKNLLRKIKKYALEEAKRTLNFSKVNKEKKIAENRRGYNEKFINEVVNKETVEYESDDLVENYQITEKRNRQKRLNYHAR